MSREENCGHKSAEDLERFALWSVNAAKEDKFLQAQIFLCEHLRINYTRILRAAWIAAQDCGASARYFEGKDESYKYDCPKCGKRVRADMFCDHKPDPQPEPKHTCKECSYKFDEPTYNALRKECCPKCYCSFGDPQPEPDMEMWLEVGRGFLEIVCGDKNHVKGLGHITADGESHILDTHDRVRFYNQWRTSGMKVREQEPVLWRGGEYKLKLFGGIMLERIDITRGEIYEFYNREYIAGCRDDNIQRWEWDNKPIGF